MFRARFLAFALSVLPVAAAGHPHVFIEAAVRLIYDRDGRLSGAEVSWSYDEFYSLLILSDYGMDPDGDGQLTPEELALLQGFDADPDPTFDGRLFLTADDAPVALTPPAGFTAALDDGRLVSRHIRHLRDPLDGAQPVDLRIYDPEFYVDFTMPDAPRIEGRDDCSIATVSGDAKAKAAAYRKAVDAVLADDDQAQEDLVIVDIGAIGADQARISCGAGA